MSRAKTRPHPPESIRITPITVNSAQNTSPKESQQNSRSPRPLSPAQKKWMAIIATWVAGFVDATGWVLLSHIYTSNMTGNSIEMSVHWVTGEWSGILQRGWPVLMFVCGLVLAAVATEVCTRRGFASFSALNLGAEAALIGCFIPLARPVFRNGEIHASSPWQFNLLVALLAVAMGIQNQTISHIGSLSFRTTHVTGTLTKFGADLAEYCFWAYDRLRSDSLPAIGFFSDSLSRPEFRGMSFMLGLWTSFVAGAIAAIVGRNHWGILALVAPVMVVAVLVVIDLIRPIGASAEVQQIRKERMEMDRSQLAA